MKVPAFLYGLYSEVEPRCRKAVTALKKGATLEELADGWVDTATHPGLLVLLGPIATMGSVPHFHCFAWARAVMKEEGKKLPRDVWARLLPQAFASGWGFLGVLGSEAQYPLYQSQELHLPFVDATLRHWSALDAEGARYWYGSATGGQRFAETPTNVRNVLVWLGVPKEEVVAIRNAEDTLRLLRRVRAEHAA